MHLKLVDGLNTGPKSRSEIFAVKADILFYLRKNPASKNDTHFSLRRNYKFGIYVLMS